MTHLFTLFLRLAQAENKCKQMGRWQSLLNISDRVQVRGINGSYTSPLQKLWWVRTWCPLEVRLKRSIKWTQHPMWQVLITRRMLSPRSKKFSGLCKMLAFNGNFSLVTKKNFLLRLFSKWGKLDISNNRRSIYFKWDHSWLNRSILWCFIACQRYACN